MKFLKFVVALAAVAVVAVVGGSYAAPFLLAPRQNVHVNSTDAALIERGRYIAQASDCAACHTVPGGKAFAGGLAMQTPIGILYSTNITPDKDNGIGGYDYADFERAVRHGIRKDGAPLYPAMPYVSYSVLTDEDAQALYAYFASGVKPVAQPDQASTIPWPQNMRWPLAWWQVVFGGHRFSPPEGATAEVARGAYLVEGPGHCGACHTPRGVAFQEVAVKDGPGGDFLSGSELEGWYAKDLRHEDTGLASWSQQDIAEFLRTGRNDRSAAFGSMGEVIQHSTQHLTEADASAIAAYLVSRPARPGHTATEPKVAEDSTTAKLYDSADHSSGALGYVARCAPCHRLNGQGTPRIFPALAGNSVVLADNPSSLIQITLSGGWMAKTPADKTDPSMPELAKLDDRTVADILTFIRNSWGNKGSAVTANDVVAMRGVIAAKPADYVPADGH